MNNYERITAAITAALAGDVPAWRKPWRDLGHERMPTNAVSKKAYRGVNTWLLALRGDDDARYVTYRQAQALGGNVRRGEHGTQIVFWKKNTYNARDKETGETAERTGLLMRLYTVFNVAQCEGIKIKPRETAPPLPVPDADAWTNALGATVEHKGDRACYSPQLDMVRMPAPGQFTNADAYAATLLHEFTHWAGHEKRLNRKLDNRFGGAAYAAEELIAELGSAYLCAELGVNSALENHASYIDSWRGLLRDDSRAIVTAASRAQAAADYVLAKLRPAAEPTAEDSDTE